MKKLLLLTLIGIFGNNSYAQWTRESIPLDSTHIIYDLHFFAPDDGWAVASKGNILRYDGFNWSIDTTIGINAFSDLVFHAQDNGWVLSGDKVYHYDGQEWSVAFQKGGELFDALEFSDPNHGMAIAWSGFVAVYDGTTWSESSLSFSGSASAYLEDERNGWFGGTGKVHRFSDSVFSEVNISSSAAVMDMFFTSPDNGYAVTWDGEIFRYADTTWSHVHTNNGGDAFLMAHFIDSSRGWTVGNGIIAKYSNGIWTEDSISGSWLHSVFFIDENTGWAAGDDGTIMKFEGVPTSIEEFSIEELNVYPNPANADIQTISGISTKKGNVNVYMISADGRIIQSQSTNASASNIVEFDVSGIKAGIYYYKIMYASKMITLKSIIQ